MKKIVFIFFLSSLAINLFGQMPFATYTKPSENLVRYKHMKKYGVSVTAINDIEIAKKQEQKNILNSRIGTMAADEKVKTQRQIDDLDNSIKALERDNRLKIEALTDEELSKADFLDHMNANIVSLQNGKKMFPTINGEVINYKLSVWTTYKKDDKGDTVKRRHYLPISLFTKISGNYADSSAGPSDDATSYFGAPLALRFSPAFELFKKHTGENKLFFGINTDMRLLLIGDTIKNKLQATWGVYGSAGFTYLGRGYAYDGQDDTDAANRHDGTWSFTAMLYFFKSGGEYNKAVFGDYEKKTLSGIEMLLRFRDKQKGRFKI